MGKMMRLDKFLVEMNKGTRSQIKEAAKKGRIQVNGVVEKKTEVKIDPETDQIRFDNGPVNYRAMEYIMLYKPQGVVSATEDRKHRTVIDLLDGDNRSDLFPVGRLDIDTEGLLLLTNDGDLTHRLLAPNKHVDKQYYAKVSGNLPEDSVKRVAAGMELEDGTPVKPAVLEILGTIPSEFPEAEPGEAVEKSAEESDAEELSVAVDPTAPWTEVILTIQEGKFHQVKRMFEVLGCHVEYLKRLSMGSLKLDETLQPGEYRSLTKEELAALRWWEQDEQ